MTKKKEPLLKGGDGGVLRVDIGGANSDASCI